MTYKSSVLLEKSLTKPNELDSKWQKKKSIIFSINLLHDKRSISNNRDNSRDKLNHQTLAQNPDPVNKSINELSFLNEAQNDLFGNSRQKYRYPQPNSKIISNNKDIDSRNQSPTKCKSITGIIDYQANQEIIISASSRNISELDLMNNDINVKMDQLIADHTKKIQDNDQNHNSIYQNPDAKKAFYNKLNISTKYKFLDHKLKDTILENGFMKKIQVDRDNSKKEKEQDKELNDIDLNAKIKKIGHESIDKSCSLYDLRARKTFNEWFNNTIVQDYFEKIDEFEKKNNVDFSKSKRSSTSSIDLFKVNKPRFRIKNPYKDMSKTVIKTNNLARTPDLRKQFIHKGMDNCSKSRSISPNISINLNKNVVNKFDNQDKTDKLIHHKREIEDLKLNLDDANDISKIEKSINLKYKALYDNLNWNDEIEKEFLTKKKENAHNMNTRKGRLANQMALIDLYRQNPELKEILKKIDQEDYENKKSFYQLYDNKISRKVIQEELNSLKPNEIDVLEAEVAKNVLSKYYNDRKCLLSERTKYYSEKREKFTKDNQLRKELDEKKKSIELGKIDQKIYSKKIRNMLKMRQNNEFQGKKIINVDQSFTNTHIYKEYIDKYPRLKNLQKALAKKNTTMDYQESWYSVNQIFNDKRERDIHLSIDNAKHYKLKENLAPKLKRQYTGGPRNSQGNIRIQNLSLNEAVTKIQALFRGILARKKCKGMREVENMKNSWIQAMARKDSLGEIETKITLMNNFISPQKSKTKNIEATEQLAKNC